MLNDVTLQDNNRFLELGKLINDNFSSLYILEDILKDKNQKIRGFYVDGMLVGFIHFSKSFEVVDVINIVVDKKYRRQGIATLLINEIINLYDDVTRIILEVNEKNEIAKSVYESNNFKVINVRKHYYGDDSAFVMERSV